MSARGRGLPLTTTINYDERRRRRRRRTFRCSPNRSKRYVRQERLYDGLVWAIHVTATRSARATFRSTRPVLYFFSAYFKVAVAAQGLRPCWRGCRQGLHRRKAGMRVACAIQRRRSPQARPRRLQRRAADEEPAPAAAGPDIAAAALTRAVLGVEGVPQRPRRPGSHA